MAKCSRCGKSMGSAKACPYCGAGASQSVVDKGVDGIARTTGTVLEKGILFTEKMYRGAAPSLKKGLSKARDETLKAARSLKDEGK